MASANPSPQNLRVAFWTLGCRLNQYETEGMKARLAGDRSVRVVPWNSPADVYILNSCTVTGKADQECRRLARQVKRRQPDSKVVVAGCYAQTQPERLREIPEVDGLVGNPDKESISTWLPELLAAAQLLVRVSPFGGGMGFTSPIVSDFDGRCRAFVKVQDGCDLACSYCLIRKARGPGRSRPVADVLTQLRELAARGFPEVVLAGVNLGSYGRDLSPRSSLPALLRILLAEGPALRVRLSSLHPDEVTPELLELFATDARLRPHVHLSLQSGSDSVLRRMRRPYRGEHARQAVQNCAAVRPDFGIGADLIVGFPGESDSEFVATVDLVESLPFSYLHVFRFSPRPGTPAADLPEPVHPETVSARSRQLRRLARDKRNSFARGMCGKWHEAVVEKRTEEGEGHLATADNYASVLLAGSWTPGTQVRFLADQSRGDLLLASEVVEIAPGFPRPAEVI